MQLLATIVAKLIPLYILILLGFVATRRLNARKETLAGLLIYMIVPVVMFFGILSTPLTSAKLVLPGLFYFLCCSICLISYAIASRFWKSPARNILAFAAGTANNGYFGLPVAVYLFGESAVGPLMLASIGFSLFENTLGFFITARGHHTAREALLRVARLPSIYAAGLAIALNFMGYTPAPGLQALGTSFRGAYTIFGMMIIGMGIADATSLRPDFKFIGISFFSRFVLWPAAMFAIILVDHNFFHFYDTGIYNVFILLASVPLAANAVAVASVLKTEPDKAAMAVLASTLFALVFIPLMIKQLEIALKF